MAITLDRGESLALTVKLLGDLSADKIRIYFSNKLVVSVKYSTDITDQAGDFEPIDGGVYDPIENLTAVTVNIEASKSLLFTPQGSWDVVVYTSKANVEFTEPFTRIAESKAAITVIETIDPAEL